MRILLDTNILIRYGDRGQPDHADAVSAVHSLEAGGHEPVIVPQVLYEYWAVATRPADKNGLGMATALVSQTVAEWAEVFSLLRDERGIYGRWHDLATAYDVKGKNAHDTRLVAAMQRHGVTHLLTFNGADFARFPGMTVLAPTDIIAGKLPDHAP